MSRLRLNVGSGQRPFGKTWTNVDLQPKWHPDVVADAQSMPMFSDNSAELVVLHHVLEHFPLDQAEKAVRECWRILAPGGSLIVIVPDLYETAKGWLKGKIDTPTYTAIIYGAYMGDEHDRHRHGWTETTLANDLMGWTGSRRVAGFDWRPLEDADVAAHDWWFFGLEVWK